MEKRNQHVIKKNAKSYAEVDDIVSSIKNKKSLKKSNE